ncbi:MAG: hypothetical protein EA406_11040 [Rhodospirillales bacterium]|nr:MAG: hypothetical protein EA406_11040 [Rhodospirillales bacterium]
MDVGDAEADPDSGAFTVVCQGRWLVARFAAPQRLLSWAPHRPGYQRGACVAWLEVRNRDLGLDVDPAALLADRLRAEGLGDAVGLMTSTRLADHCRASVRRGGSTVRCLVTVGLGNAERVGSRRPGAAAGSGFGTVNLLCHVDRTLTDAAMLEAVSVATAARTTAILEAGYRPAGAGGPVTGTGTDCIVIVCPADTASGTTPEPYAGLHTAVGEAIGAAVLEATRQGVAGWLARQGADAQTGAAAPHHPCRTGRETRKTAKQSTMLDSRHK